MEKLTQIIHILHFFLYIPQKSSIFALDFENMNALSEIRFPIEDSWRAYERLMEQSLHADNKLQQEVLRHVGSSRGKQLRPLVVLLCAQICDTITDKTLRSAVALELLHTASLIHDDVVDSSDTRRGVEAVHAKWTNKIAVLVGDYMLAKVIGLIAEIVSNLGKNLSSGEMVQLHVGQSMWIDEARYLQVIEQKTAQLFQACAEAGAESAGCTPKQRAALREYGKMLGLCFQIKDDIFDYSDLEEIGKPTMSDLRDGKVTLPLIESLRRAPKDEAEEIKAKYAVQQMLAYKKKATEALSVFRDSAEKRSLIALLDFAINRVQ